MTTSPETFQAQYPLALAALAAHIAAHHLPAPPSIDVANVLRDGHVDQAIRVYLPAEPTHQAWLDSVAVDSEDDELSGSGLGIRCEWSVRLPDTGFRFQLVGFQSRVLRPVSA